MAELAEKARINLADRLRVAYHGELLDWHDKKSEKLSSKLSIVNRQINSTEESIKGLFNALETVKSAFGEDSPRYESAAKIVNKERRRLELRREGLENRRDRLQSELEFRDQKKAIYERRRKEIIKEVSERIRERLEPYEERIRDLEGWVGRINERIRNFEEMKSRLAERLEELEEKKEKAVSRTEAKIIQGIIRGIKKEQKKTREYISRETEEAMRLEAELARQRKKMAPWRNKLNEFRRISQREVTYWETGEREAVPLNSERWGVSGPSYGLEEKPGHEKSAFYGSDESYESREVNKKLLPADYIRGWNRYFEGELYVDPNEFEEKLKERLETDELESMSIPDLEYFFRLFYSEKWESRHYLVRYGAKKELDKRLRSLRVYLNV
jgi:predicted  nucleic acid-binding Zn-ribbon protein